MSNISQTKWIFRMSRTVFVILFLLGLLQLSKTNKEAEKIYNMPLGDYKIMYQKNMSEDDKIKVFKYKAIVNENIGAEDLKSISENIIEKAKNTTDINGVEILMYSNPDEIKSDQPTVAQVIYAPGGNLNRALNETNVNYSDFSYYINPKTRILKNYISDNNFKNKNSVSNSSNNSDEPIK